MQSEVTLLFAEMGVSNIFFFLAALPVQLVILFFYVNRRQLPLRESRSFLFLMIWNTVLLLTDFLMIYMDAEGFPGGRAFLYLFFFSAFLMEDYLLFYYFCDALRADDFGGIWVRRLTFIPVAAGIVYFGVQGARGFSFYELAEFFRTLNMVFLFFYGALSALLVWFRRRENSFRRNAGFAACLGVLLFGIGSRALYPEILFAGYFFTLAIFIIYLTVRNPDFYVEHQTRLLNKAAFRLVAEDRLQSCGIHGFGFVIKDYEEGRILYGSAFIDSFLENIGLYLEKEFPEEDAFYLGNGRFFLLGVHAVDEEESAGRLHRRFRDPWISGKRSAFFDICCCLMEEGLHFSHVDELMQVITFAFDVAGRPGQEDFTADDAYEARVKRQVHVRRLMMHALDRDSLEVYLQPIVNAETEKVEGAEALVRLTEADGRIIPPDEFIPAAESSGAVSVLGLQVFGKVCAFIRKGGLTRCGMKWINVNVSPVQCLARDLPKKLDEIRRAYGVSLSSIHLEITEQGVLGPGGFRQLEHLHHRGFDIVLDDFGTGYANSSSVKKISLSGIKIDMSLVRAHFRHPDPYLPNLIKSLRDLGFAVTAEGVETKEMAEALRAMGCHYFQGFYYSRPIPMDEFVKKYGK